MWTEANNVLSYSQNGFHKDRNCQDHLFTNQVQGTVRVNNSFTDWFPIETGVKQGCLLSLHCCLTFM